MADPRVSVIIPVHNRAALLERCVRSVPSGIPGGAEVVVVDDGSTEDIGSRLDDLPQVRVARREIRGGPGAARNSGVAASRGEWLFFLDSDTQVHAPGWALRHLICHRGEKPGVATGGVVGVHTTYGGAVDSLLNWFMFQSNPERMVRKWHVPMVNVSMPRAVFERVGPFREDLETLEDVDWSYRARAAGVPFRFARKAQVLHWDRDGLWAAFQHQREFGRSQRHLRGRHPDSPNAWLFPRTLAGGMAMTLPIVLLMTVYVVAVAALRDPRSVFYSPGILFGHLGHGLGILEGLWGRDREVM